jgi:uncharacterized protein (TIRG00374 family)
VKRRLSGLLAVLRTPAGRIGIVVPSLAGLAALLYFRGPDWRAVGHAFAEVRWEFLAAGVGFNLLSIVARSLAWSIVIGEAVDPPRPRHRLVFSAFCVGLLANVVLPGRVGELARVAVLIRRMPGRTGLWPRLVGTVFAHRIFDLVPSLALILYVLITAKVPAWATTSLIIVVGVGVGLFAFAFAVARRHHLVKLDELSTFRRIIANARVGLGVMRAPRAAGGAVFFQAVGWLCQFFAVWITLRAFAIHVGFPAAGLVLVLMNIAIIVPLWPGNVGLLQAAVAVPLAHYYGVDYDHAFAFAVGLQAMEASVGVGVGLVFLAREGLSMAVLRGMGAPAGAEVDAEGGADGGAAAAEMAPGHAAAGSSG